MNQFACRCGYLLRISNKAGALGQFGLATTAPPKRLNNCCSTAFASSATSDDRATTMAIGAEVPTRAAVTPSCAVIDEAITLRPAASQPSTTWVARRTPPTEGDPESSRAAHGRQVSTADARSSCAPVCPRPESSRRPLAARVAAPTTSACCRRSHRDTRAMLVTHGRRTRMSVGCRRETSRLR